MFCFVVFCPGAFETRSLLSARGEPESVHLSTATQGLVEDGTHGGEKKGRVCSWMSSEGIIDGQ